MRRRGAVARPALLLLREREADQAARVGVALARNRSSGCAWVGE